MTTVGRIDPRTLNDRLRAREPLLLLDVREPLERDLATIPVPAGIPEIAIPMAAIQARLEEIQAAAVGRETVVYCHHGQRSMVVARWLAARGMTGLLNLEGGIDSWSTTVDKALPRY